jgi:hypothetical protein
MGFVIFEGEYLSPPYVIGQRDNELLINGRVVAATSFDEPVQGPGQETGGRRGRRSAWRGVRPGMMVTRVELVLQANGMVIVLDNSIVRFADAFAALQILESLLSDATKEAKVRSLSQSGVERVTSAQWASIVETFRSKSELVERSRHLLERFKATWQESESSHERLIAGAFFRSEPVRYGATLATMGLTVIAMGTLLTYRPDTRSRWRDYDCAGDGVAVVVRNVVLLVLLGVVDLVLTLVAQQAGGFLELNPLGNKLTDSPILLASFKGSTLLVACLILLSLRRYRGAQIASWWLCLTCTFLTFRWLTYNSLFLT